MRSTDSSGPSVLVKTAVRAAIEGVVLAVAGAAIVGGVWKDPGIVAGARFGIAAAWAASAVSVTWLLWARGREMKVFWWAFGGGMALRAGVLTGLALWGWKRTGVSMDALLLSYVFGLLAMLLTLEFRHLRLT